MSVWQGRAVKQTLARRPVRLVAWCRGKRKCPNGLEDLRVCLLPGAAKEGPVALVMKDKALPGLQTLSSAQWFHPLPVLGAKQIIPSLCVLIS